MRLIGHTSGQYKGRTQSLLSSDESSPLDYAFLEIRQTWEMLKLIKDKDKALYDRSNFDTISRTLENMLPEYREGTNHIIANAQQLLEQEGSRGATAKAQRMAQTAAAHDNDLVEAYLLVMQNINARLNQTVSALSAEDQKSVKSLPTADKEHAFDWPHSATVHANAAVNFLRQEVAARAQAPDGPQAAAL